jgi:lysozyme family protein
VRDFKADMMDFEPFIDKVLAVEGGYVDLVDDRGGPTNYGITKAVARANGYDGHMRDLPVNLARQIYRNRYIVVPQFDKVAQVSPSIAHELIDTGVNMGPAVPSLMLQRWLNGFNQRGSRYADLFADGRIGNVTIEALRAFVRWRGSEGERVMVAALNCTQGGRYLELAEANQTQEAFLYGWVLNRVAA